MFTVVTHNAFPPATSHTD